MTQEQVEAIVEARPGGYALFWAPGRELTEKWGEPSYSLGWSDTHGYLRVGFDEEGRVCNKWLMYGRDEQIAWDRSSFWQRFKRRSIPSAEPMIGYIQF